MGGKWLELLKQIAPGITQAAVLPGSSITAGVGQFAAIQSVAPLLGVELRPVDVRDAGEIERAVAAFALRSNSGLIVTLTGQASRSDQHTRGPAPIARSLLLPLLRHQR